ncbi:Lrp/AsnC family transcriptional regulator [Rhizobium sp. 18055]|uniref:Lrp/AsnC family transcriptional regulator n=1 Tax=Rhizobium sp. 18055 TaxID=2681403 RepID=UPI0013583F45|nr:Lrp/AsnC family transcriptional regulator [Rhizobium sp. 18055]
MSSFLRNNPASNEGLLRVALDAIDRNIVRQLRLNARIANTALATEVGLSPSACLRRIARLENTGHIRGYTALIGTSDSDDALAVIVNITLDRQTEEHLNRFEAAIRKHPEIQECFLMTGGSDYILKVEVESARDFERIHKDILSTLPGVARIHSSFSIRDVLKRRARKG